MANREAVREDAPPPSDARAAETVPVIRLFEAAARGTPDAVALVALSRDGGRPELQISYARLNRIADHLAARLRARGVGVESVVAVAVGHDAATIASFLAAMKAGAAFLPLDAALPEARLKRYVERSGARVLLAPRERAARYAGLAAETLVVDDSFRPSPAEPAAPPAPLHPLNAAYVVYTSGSTGEPKGVVVAHGGLANHNRGFAEIVGLGARDATLQFASPAFDAAYEEIFSTLARGGRLVLRTDEMAQDAEALARRCAEQQVTLVDVPTAFWRTLASLPRPGGPPLPDTVRWVVIGGEEAQAADVEAWRERAHAGSSLLNSYGPTEATIVATARELLHAPFAAEDGVPLGAALPGTAVRLLDGGREVGAGEVGEIHVAGAGVARGYLGSPRLTAERFVPDAGGEAGGRAYRTGDLAERTPAGELVFRGRRDHQVKVRGHRVQLEEVEGALLEHPAIQSCAVMLRDDRRGGKHLVAYCVLSHAERALPFETSPLSTMALKDFLRERLPAPMVPSEFSFLEKFILTPGGKIDRARLPEIGRLDRARRGLPEYDRPRPGVEERIARIWCDVLDLDADEISAEDPFEYMGGNSLYSIQIRHRAREQGLLFAAGDLHLRQTVRGLARCCEPAEGALSRGRHALRDHASYVRGLGKVLLRQVAGTAGPRRRALEARTRRRVRAFYEGLENQENVFYLFFTTHLLHWLSTTAGLVPRDVNLVLIGSGLRGEEVAWVRERIDRPFLHLEEEVDLDLIWDVLFDVNRRNFGWLDVDCFVMNPGLFREMAAIRPDEAINTVWTHAACGPTKRPFHVLESYFLFFNVEAIERLRAEKVLPRPSAKTASLRQADALKRLIPADPGNTEHLERLGGGAFAHRLLDFEFARLILYQLVANARGYRLNRVRFFTEIDTFNPYNYYSDETIHVFPSIRYYDQRRPWNGSDQTLRLAADHLLMTRMLDRLPPMYQARKRFLDEHLHHLPFPIAEAPARLREYLGARGVTERTFSLDAFAWMHDEPRRTVGLPPGLHVVRDVAGAT